MTVKQKVAYSSYVISLALIIVASIQLNNAIGYKNEATEAPLNWLSTGSLYMVSAIQAMFLYLIATIILLFGINSHINRD